MRSRYVQTAMHQACYEILEDQTFYGEIRDLGGVYANGATLEECREQLREVLEGWIILGLRMGHRMPTLNGLGLNGHFRLF
ncbi:MAG: type II toxin-antitoxin system HicB family antitoxin [Desulfococcaceae bacterium]